MADFPTNRVYFGTSSGDPAQGIFCAEFEPQRGRLSAPRLVASLLNPSFLAYHPTRRFLYAVGEEKKSNGDIDGTVTAFAIDQTAGDLRPLNRAYAGGSAPCHLVVDRTGRHVLIANYDGNATVLALRPDGTLGPRTAHVRHLGTGPNRERQDGPHAHSIHLDAANRFVFVPDLGIDKIMVYRFDENAGTLTPHEPAHVATHEGAGPRHFAFDATQKHAYLVNELDASVIVFDYDAANGTLIPQQTLSSLPKNFSGANTAAEIAVHPSGRFVYTSNRGHDSLAVFTVARESGELSLLQHVTGEIKHPRHFAIDSSGQWLLCANRDANNVTVYRIDQESGRLERTPARIAVPAPVCVRF